MINTDRVYYINDKRHSLTEYLTSYQKIIIIDNIEINTHIFNGKIKPGNKINNDCNFGRKY